MPAPIKETVASAAPSPSGGPGYFLFGRTRDEVTRAQEAAPKSRQRLNKKSVILSEARREIFFSRKGPTRAQSKDLVGLTGDDRSEINLLRTTPLHRSTAKKHLPILLAAFLLLTLHPLHAYQPPTAPAPRPFRYDTDTFSFANETVWNYVNGALQSGSSHPQTQKRDYTRRCFVVTRAAVQFWKFARFDPHAAPLSKEQLADRIRDVTDRDVWLPPLPREKRVAFPGYSSLREISAADPAIFQANIGLGWPVYFRAGNMPIVAPVYRETEAHLNGEIYHDIHFDYPTLVWLYNFPSLNINHVVVIYAGERDGGQYHYRVYDPNYTNGPKKLDYDVATRTVSYPPTFYFKGGAVEARAVYRGILQ